MDVELGKTGAGAGHYTEVRRRVGVAKVKLETEAVVGHIDGQVTRQS